MGHVADLVRPGDRAVPDLADALPGRPGQGHRPAADRGAAGGHRDLALEAAAPGADRPVGGRAGGRRRVGAAGDRPDPGVVGVGQAEVQRGTVQRAAVRRRVAGEEAVRGRDRHPGAVGQHLRAGALEALAGEVGAVVADPDRGLHVGVDLEHVPAERERALQIPGPGAGEERVPGVGRVVVQVRRPGVRAGVGPVLVDAVGRPAVHRGRVRGQERGVDRDALADAAAAAAPVPGPDRRAARAVGGDDLHAGLARRDRGRGVDEVVAAGRGGAGHHALGDLQPGAAGVRDEHAPVGVQPVQGRDPVVGGGDPVQGHLLELRPGLAGGILRGPAGQPADRGAADRGLGPAQLRLVGGRPGQGRGRCGRGRRGRQDGEPGQPGGERGQQQQRAHRTHLHLDGSPVGANGTGRRPRVGATDRGAVRGFASAGAPADGPTSPPQPRCRLPTGLPAVNLGRGPTCPSCPSRAGPRLGSVPGAAQGGGGGAAVGDEPEGGRAAGGQVAVPGRVADRVPGCAAAQVPAPQLADALPGRPGHGHRPAADRRAARGHRHLALEPAAPRAGRLVAGRAGARTATGRAGGRAGGRRRAGGPGRGGGPSRAGGRTGGRRRPRRGRGGGSGRAGVAVGHQPGRVGLRHLELQRRAQVGAAARAAADVAVRGRQRHPVPAGVQELGVRALERPAAELAAPGAVAGTGAGVDLEDVPADRVALGVQVPRAGELVEEVPGVGLVVVEIGGPLVGRRIRLVDVDRVRRTAVHRRRVRAEEPAVDGDRVRQRPAVVVAPAPGPDHRPLVGVRGGDLHAGLAGGHRGRGVDPFGVPGGAHVRHHALGDLDPLAIAVRDELPPGVVHVRQRRDLARAPGRLPGSPVAGDLREVFGGVVDGGRRPGVGLVADPPAADRGGGAAGVRPVGGRSRQGARRAGGLGARGDEQGGQPGQPGGQQRQQQCRSGRAQLHLVTLSISGGVRARTEWHTAEVFGMLHHIQPTSGRHRADTEVGRHRSAASTSPGTKDFRSSEPIP